ncbi:MAG: RNA polymerase sigma factor [Planctomycetes bacterium]|nr:RNA polymerase sigma factor [Planctomycetota bacterium]
MAEPLAPDLLRLAPGDPAALGALYQRHARDVQRLVLGMRLGLGREEVEDAVQETFLRALRDLQRFDRARPLRGWVLGIARHVAVDRARRGRVRAAAPVDGGAVVDPGPAGGEDAAARAEQAALVTAALGALEPEQRAALALRHVEGLTMDDLAAALDCSVPTARARLREAAHRLAGELRRRGLGAGEVTS